MLTFSTIWHTQIDAYPALLSGLRREFQSNEIELVAALFLDAEADDFHWEHRIAERGLGRCEAALEDPEIELDRVAILGLLAGRWYAGIACVDGDGRLWTMHECADFPSLRAAERAFRGLF